jgi:hypothetical protein
MLGCLAQGHLTKLLANFSVEDKDHLMPENFQKVEEIDSHMAATVCHMGGSKRHESQHCLGQHNTTGKELSRVQMVLESG